MYLWSLKNKLARLCREIRSAQIKQTRQASQTRKQANNWLRRHLFSILYESVNLKNISNESNSLARPPLSHRIKSKLCPLTRGFSRPYLAEQARKNKIFVNTLRLCVFLMLDFKTESEPDKQVHKVKKIKHLKKHYRALYKAKKRLRSALKPLSNAK